MFYTDFQKEAMRYVGLAKVHYKDMWKNKGQLGYVVPGRPNDNIYIAKDFEDEKVRKIALLHECGHIKFNHTSVNMKQEFKYVKALFKKLNKPYMTIQAYGGPMGFCNIAMDLEVNSKLLTLANTRYMDKAGFKVCTPEGFDLDVMDTYRDYYIPLIEKLPDDDEEFQEFQDMMKNIIKDLMKDISSKQKGKSSGSGSDSGNGQDDQDKEDQDQNGKGGSSEQDDEDDEESGFVYDEADFDEDDEDCDEENVNEAVRDDENSDKVVGFDGQDDGTSSPAGRGHYKNSNLEVKDNCSAVIKGFLQKIVGSSMVYLPDSMKHYNRGSRANADGFLYSSIRKRNRTDKKRFGICIDVSGSMNTESILTALGSLKSALSVVDNNSIVVTWDDYLCEEFPITKVPQRVSNGGGTSMHRGLQYLIEKGCDNIVMYSDFETDVSAMIRILRKAHVNMYSIAVADNHRSDISKKDYRPSWGCSDEEWKDYIKLNKDWILVR